MKTFEYFLLVGSIIFVLGCASASLSGTGVVTPYGTANSINATLNTYD